MANMKTRDFAAVAACNRGIAIKNPSTIFVATVTDVEPVVRDTGEPEKIIRARTRCLSRNRAFSGNRQVAVTGLSQIQEPLPWLVYDDCLVFFRSSPDQAILQTVN